jgi:hypothetical protein
MGINAKTPSKDIAHCPRFKSINSLSTLIALFFYEDVII